MKTKFFIAVCLLFSVMLIGTETKAQNKESNLSISVSDSKNIYEYSARYDADKTQKVLSYMDDHLKDTGVKFRNMQVDAELTLNNKMTFYMKSSPGILKFKFDKRKNSAEFYKQFKQMCEGIKKVIGENR